MDKAEKKELILDCVDSIKASAGIFDDTLEDGMLDSAVKYFVNEAILDLDDILELINPEYSGKLMKAFEDILAEVKKSVSNSDEH